MTSTVAIPLGQGQVFNATHGCAREDVMVAIPLGQGQVFNKELMTFLATETESQSLWVRDRFLITLAALR